MVAKFAAFAATGSGAMLSEGVHSLADVLNQGLLALGIRQSRLPADAEHPYGYGRERFIWALVSAVGIFFLGCGVSVYHGIMSLLHPHGIEAVDVAFAVLALSFVIEGATLVVAVRAVRANARDAGVTFRHYLLHGSDPMGVAVVLEDAAAVLGVCIAAACIGLGVLTGAPYWDAIGAILIGLLMGAVAIFLARRNRELLIGQSMEPASKARILAVLNASPVVEEILDVKATVVDANSVRFKAEIEFDGAVIARRFLDRTDLDEELKGLRTRADLEAFLVRFGDHVVEALGDEIDVLEDQIRAAEPAATHVDLEAN
jgi:solute carrier family 30 (zinc transporter), member 9